MFQDRFLLVQAEHLGPSGLIRWFCPGSQTHQNLSVRPLLTGWQNRPENPTRLEPAAAGSPQNNKRFWFWSSFHWGRRTLRKPWSCFQCGRNRRAETPKCSLQNRAGPDNNCLGREAENKSGGKNGNKHLAAVFMWTADEPHGCQQLK